MMENPCTEVAFYCEEQRLTFAEFLLSIADGLESHEGLVIPVNYEDNEIEIIRLALALQGHRYSRGAYGILLVFRAIAENWSPQRLVHEMY